MAADCTAARQSDADLLSLMRTLASLTESAKLRGDDLSAGVFSSVAGLLAEVHVARELDATGEQCDVSASPLIEEHSTVCL